MKYHNVTILTREGKFDSKYEYEVWCQLKLMEKAGKIRQLERQYPFEIIPQLKTSAGTLRAIKYIADFVYTDSETGDYFAIDTKGFETETYKLKKRLFILNYPNWTFIERKRNKKDKIYLKKC